MSFTGKVKEVSYFLTISSYTGNMMDQPSLKDLEQFNKLQRALALFT